MNQCAKVTLQRPLWYSYDDKKHNDESHEELPAGHSSHWGSNTPNGYCRTILDQTLAIDKNMAYSQAPQPSRQQTIALWEAYLENVHPLVKVFFAWDKKPIIDKAAEDPTSLTAGQQALVSAIFFIAVSSLSKSQCEQTFNGAFKRTLLNDFQSMLETALMAAKYATTSDLLVLQALVLYLVSCKHFDVTIPVDRPFSWQCVTELSLLHYFP